MINDISKGIEVSLAVLELIKFKHPMGVTSEEIYRTIFDPSAKTYGSVESKRAIRLLRKIESCGYVYGYQPHKHLIWKLTPNGANLLGVPCIIINRSPKE